MKPKVYITQENSRLNYADAERFGEIHFVTDREIRGKAHARGNRAAAEDVAGVAADFDLRRDYILIAGDPIVGALTVAMVVQRAIEENVPTIQMLKWDGQTRQYYEVELGNH